MHLRTVTFICLFLSLASCRKTSSANWSFTVPPDDFADEEQILLPERQPDRETASYGQPADALDASSEAALTDEDAFASDESLMAMPEADNSHTADDSIGTEILREIQSSKPE